MNLWSIFITGLFAGGASCAAIQGGLLVASVVRRGGGPAPVPVAYRQRSTKKVGKGKNARKKQQQIARANAQRARLARRATAATPSFGIVDDVVPVGSFLAGKLVSHTLLGAALGLFGASAQLSFRTRALMQIFAGGLMLLMAANILGVPGLQFLVPSPPARLTRLVRKSARSEAAFAPAILGFSTVLIPCGITISVMFLAIASGSPLWGAAGMATFVLGTSPLFAIIGYVLHRSAGKLRGTVTKLAAGAVVLAALVSINTGLVLRGSSFTLSGALDGFVGGQQGPAVAAPADASGVQQLTIDVHNTSFSPSRLQVKAGAPAVLTLHTNGTSGCTRGFVIPSMDIQRQLPETGSTTIDLGIVGKGTIHFTCSMGMYRGEIEVV